MNIGIALALLFLSAGKESTVEELAKYVEGANQGVVIERKDAETWVLHLRANPEKTAVFRLALLRETLGPNPERLPVEERRKTYERLLAGLLSSLAPGGGKTADRIFPRLHFSREDAEAFLQQTGPGGALSGLPQLVLTQRQVSGDPDARAAFVKRGIRETKGPAGA